MRKLTVSERINDYNLKRVEDLVGNVFTENFKDFMKLYAGLSHVERYFIDASKTEWEVISYINSVELYKLTDEFKQAYKRKLVPFAFDPGGWHFCLSFDESDYGAIIVNRWTDHLPEEQFLKIADSFEDFINGLKREEVDR